MLDIFITNILNITFSIKKLSASYIYIYTYLYRHKRPIILASSSPILSWKLCRFLQAFIRSATCHSSDSSRRIGWHGIMQTFCISHAHSHVACFVHARSIHRQMLSRSTHFPTMLDPFIIRCRGSDTVAVDQTTGIKMTRGRHTGSYLARSTMECDGSHGGCLRSDRIFHLLLISMIQESLTLHVLCMNNEPISTRDCLFADLIRLERSIQRENITIYEVSMVDGIRFVKIYYYYFFYMYKR